MGTLAATLDTRERLLRAGETLARQKGLRALTVRAVTAQAEANVGSFVHHFGTREAFVTELIERHYGPLMASLQLAAENPVSPLDALRQALLRLVRWLQAHRAFMAQVLLDGAAGEPAAQRFVRTLGGRHPAVLLGLIVAAQEAGALRRDEPAHQMLFLMSTLALPVLALHLLGKSASAAPPLARSLAAYAFEPDAAAQRLEWALRGLAPEPESPP